MTGNKIKQLRHALTEADAVIIGAGAGLSTSAGFTYTGERFHKYFLILKKNMDFMICIAEVFIPMIRWKSTGHTGADISTSTVI